MIIHLKLLTLKTISGTESVRSMFDEQINKPVVWVQFCSLPLLQSKSIQIGELQSPIPFWNSISSVWRGLGYIKEIWYLVF
jgi:hypothetical protein